MPLFDFFRINLPYGLQKNPAEEWFAFNREYVPLGWNRTHGDKSVFGDRTFAKYPIHTKYKRLTENAILKIIKEDHAIQRGEDGKIMRIFFIMMGSIHVQVHNTGTGILIYLRRFHSLTYRMKTGRYFNIRAIS